MRCASTGKLRTMRLLLPAPADPTATARSRRDLLLGALAAGGYVGLGAATRRGPGRGEYALFHYANHEARDHPALRVPQQLGTPWVLPLLAVLATLTHRPHLAVQSAVALPLSKGLEVLVKKLLGRPRPAQDDPRARLRDDAPTEGPSYPSGHGALAFAAVGVAGPYVTAPVRAAGLALAAASSWVRVQQGAHYPADVVGGALLAGAVVGTVRAVVGVPARG